LSDCRHDWKVLLMVELPVAVLLPVTCHVKADRKAMNIDV
jgi:hypothetical protein